MKKGQFMIIMISLTKMTVFTLIVFITEGCIQLIMISYCNNYIPSGDVHCNLNSLS